MIYAVNFWTYVLFLTYCIENSSYLEYNCSLETYIVLEESIVVKFKDALRDYIKKNGYSINEFANKCDIDRAWLSNVLSGRKELSEAKFNNIIKSNLLSETQNENLTALYKLRDFTDEQIKRMEYMHERLSRKVRRAECLVPIDYDKDRKMYLGKTTLLSVLFRIIENRKKISFVYTNIPAESEEAIDVCYHFFKKEEYKDIDYKHIFMTDGGTSTHNLNTYFTVCDMAELGFTGFSIIKDVEIDSIENNDFFPYFLLTDVEMLFFDAEFNNAMYTDNQRIIKVYIRKFKNLYEKGEKVVSSFTNAVELMRTLTTMHDSTSELAFTPDFCITPCLDHDILSENAAENLPNKELLIQAVLNHYNIDYSKFYNFLTIDSINRFFKDGIIYEIPRTYLKPIDIKGRIKLLECLKDNIEKKGKYNSYILNPTKFDYNSYDIQAEKVGVVAVCGIRQDNRENDRSFMGEWLCSINDENIFKDFINLKRILVEGLFVYSDEFSSSYVSNLILELSAQLNGEIN